MTRSGCRSGCDSDSESAVTRSGCRSGCDSDSEPAVAARRVNIDLHRTGRRRRPPFGWRCIPRAVRRIGRSPSGPRRHQYRPRPPPGQPPPTPPPPHIQTGDARGPSAVNSHWRRGNGQRSTGMSSATPRARWGWDLGSVPLVMFPMATCGLIGIRARMGPRTVWYGIVCSWAGGSRLF